MTIPPALKDTNNWHMISGLDEEGEAQELTFDEDQVKVSIDDSVSFKALSNLIELLGESVGEMITQLKIMNTYLSVMTDQTIKEEDL